MAEVIVSGLFIYPVKGLSGISLQQSVLQPTGLEFDRFWMVVMPNGRMVTQRQVPTMSSIFTRLTGNQLILGRQNDPDLIIELNQVPERQVPVSVWSDSFTALDEGERASAWFSRVLSSKYPLRLVRMDKRVVRPQSKPDLLGEDTSTRFADAAPYLLTSEASLEFLNTRLKSKGLKAMPMNRFRPNIIVRGLTAFEEFNQGVLSNKPAGYRLSSRYPCQRCNVTTVNQLTGEVDKITGEPLVTLEEMNRFVSQKGAYFGQNMTLKQGRGRLIQLGDQLTWQPAGTG